VIITDMIFLETPANSAVHTDGRDA